jgi:hypothetical protein
MSLALYVKINRLAGTTTEKEDEAAQRRSGMAPWTRLAGLPSSVKYGFVNGVISLSSSSLFISGGYNWVTIGAPEALVNSGVLYYEIAIMAWMTQGTSPQFGFSLKDGVPATDRFSDVGVGDNPASWAVDGARKCAWNNGHHLWPACVWKEGDVIGLAANVDVGKLAMSINGDWAGAGRGVVFKSEAIKKGMFPCSSVGNANFDFPWQSSNTNHQTQKFGRQAEFGRDSSLFVHGVCASEKQLPSFVFG